MSSNDLELIACTPYPVDPAGFNPDAVIPYECAVTHIQFAMNDFIDSGRSEQSRRTITASVAKSGYQKMLANWIYRDASLDKGKLPPVVVK